MQNRRFHFNVAMTIQIATNLTDDLAAFHESVKAIFITDQIQITLTVTLLDVGKSMVFVREWA